MTLRCLDGDRQKYLMWFPMVKIQQFRWEFLPYIKRSPSNISSGALKASLSPQAIVQAVIISHVGARIASWLASLPSPPSPTHMPTVIHHLCDTRRDQLSFLIRSCHSSAAWSESLPPPWLSLGRPSLLLTGFPSVPQISNLGYDGHHLHLSCRISSTERSVVSPASDITDAYTGHFSHSFILSSS